MLEALISSRIRRALFEHILMHPSERFYLRGLAKSLDLSVSPLRRELKRLEQSGMLQASQEGNMLFYTVNTGAPAFLQLQQAGQQTNWVKGEGSRVKGGEEDLITPLHPSPFTLHPHAPAAPSRSAVAWSAPLPTGALIGAAGVGVALLVVVASLLYIRLTDREKFSKAFQALTTREAEIVVAPSRPSGVMRGSRWQISPGGIGGFSSAANSGTFQR